MLDGKRAPDTIYRIARRPDPWQPPDWSRANPDGTFGNRFDDPEGYYRVIYASSQKLSCFLETLARFRADLSLLAELNEIEGENDFFPLGTVPREWCDERLIGSAHAEGNYADTYGAEWIAYLRHRLAGECLRLGLNDVDASLLQRSAPRRLTQLAALEARRQGFDGIYYRSRHGHDLENWALFEPFRISPTTSQPVAADDQTFMEALRILELRLV
ncbi:MAG: RES family NAD+ phosphorylase [Candidatus Sulfotelmatobacter sp.]